MELSIRILVDVHENTNQFEPPDPKQAEIILEEKEVRQLLGLHSVESSQQLINELTKGLADLIEGLCQATSILEDEEPAQESSI